MPSNQKPTIVVITLVVLLLLFGTVLAVVAINHVAPDTSADVTIVSSSNGMTTDGEELESGDLGQQSETQPSHSISSLTNLTGPWAAFVALLFAAAIVLVVLIRTIQPWS